jgi:hypothetical protein
MTKSGREIPLSKREIHFSLLDFPFSMTELVISLLDKGISKSEFR